MVKDAAYHAWRERNKGVVGLRVRWQWTDAQRRQAPDTREFRIYYHAGPINALYGRAVTVSAVNSLESDVETEIASDRSEHSYAGTRLDVGAHGFEVVASRAGDPLHVRVRHTGPIYNAGTLSVVLGSPTVTGVATDWKADFAGTALQVIHDTSGRVSVRSDSSTLDGIDTDWSAELVGLSFRLAEERTAYRIASVDPSARLTLDRNYRTDSAARKGYIIFDDSAYIVAPSIRQR